MRVVSVTDKGELLSLLGLFGISCIVPWKLYIILFAPHFWVASCKNVRSEEAEIVRGRDAVLQTTSWNYFAAIISSSSSVINMYKKHYQPLCRHILMISAGLLCLSSVVGGGDILVVVFRMAS